MECGVGGDDDFFFSCVGEVPSFSRLDDLDPPPSLVACECDLEGDCEFSLFVVDLLLLLEDELGGGDVLLDLEIETER